MGVYDRWHKSHPRPGDEPCKEHSRGRAKLCASKEHMQGDRWQVRWKDPDGNQRSKNFRLKEGKNPELHADAFDKQIQAELAAGNYIDPVAAEQTFGEYALERVSRKNITPNAKRRQLGHLSKHVLEDPENPGRTRGGGYSLGQRSFADLQKRASYTSDWMGSLGYLEKSSQNQVIAVVSFAFNAARKDGLIRVNPTLDGRPKVVPKKAQAWTPEIVAAVAEGLRLKEERFEIIAYLGAATGERQGEMFGFAGEDIGEPEFFRRQLTVQVRRQVQVVDGVLCFCKVKNEKEHTVPVPAAFAEMLIAYMERFPPAEVTLPWEKPGGELVTQRLIITRPDGRALESRNFNAYYWKPALGHAGLIPVPSKGQRWAKARDKGCHRLRHTAVSQWLSEGASVSDVAAWIGDTETEVYKTYSHMMAGAEEKGRRGMAKFFANLPSVARKMHS